MNESSGSNGEEQAIDELRDLLVECPAFEIDGRNVHFLNEPNEFYEKLQSLTRSAKRRIVIASLYIGNGELEQKLIDNLTTSARNGVDVTVLLDYARGTRGPHSSCDVLKQFVNTGGKLHLYHSMALRGLVRRLLPSRWNEGLGLQHMKVYIFDDTIIISGANLSDTYFTNRQDRCMLVEDSPTLSDFYAHVIDTVASCSFQLHPNTDTLALDPRCLVHPFKGSRHEFTSMLHSRLTAVVQKWRGMNARKQDTQIYPYIQCGVGAGSPQNLGTNIFLQNTNLHITLASGYFNLIDEYTNYIINEGKYGMRLIVASPQANGFYKAHGISGNIPYLYSCAVQNFLREQERSNRNLQNDNTLPSRLSTYEWRKPAWTFHAKGLWLAYRDRHPFATIVGSSNYGYRSQQRDMETGVVLVTHNAPLRRRVHDERVHMTQNNLGLTSSTFANGAEHCGPFWVRFVYRFARHFF